MTYEEVKYLSAMAGLFIFITFFIGVVVYVFWPSNRKTFDQASHIPLEKDQD